MPRVVTVKKAQKDQGTCGRCGDPLPPGTGYRWWKFRFGGKRVRCLKSECRPSRSDLTQSDKLGRIYDAQDTWSAALDSFREERDLDSLTSARDDVVNEFREVGEEYCDSASSMRDYFPNSDQADEIEEKGNSCEEVACELENWSPDEYAGDEEDEETLAEWAEGVADDAENLNTEPDT